MYGIPCDTRILNKRQAALFAACLALGIVLGRYAYLTNVYLIAAAAMTAAAFLIRRKAAIIGLAIFLLLGAAYSSLLFNVDYVSTGKSQNVSGYVYSEPYHTDSGSVVLMVTNAHIDGQPCGNIKLYAPKDTDILCGDVIFAVADTKVPAGVRNPGGFDEKLYLLSQGVHYQAYASQVRTLGTHTALAVVLANVRAGVGETIDVLFEEDISPVVRGILLGDRYGIDENTYTNFKDSGLANVLAVSGLHAGILIAAIFGLLKLLRVGRRAQFLATLAFMAFYAGITGFTPSILRASLMAASLLAARFFGRQADSLNALSIAFIISLLINPLDLFSAGFLLSFGAVFGILTLGWQINRRLEKRTPAYLSGTISATIGATAGTLPVMASAFNRVSLLGILTNIIAVPLASFAIVFSFMTVAAGFVIGQSAQYLGYIAAAVIRLMLGMTSGIGVLPFAAIDVASPPWYSIAVWYIMLFLLSKYLLIKIRIKTLVAAALFMVVVSVMLLSRPAGLYVVFLDVGQGDAAFIRTAQGGEYFFDGGREQSADEIISFTIRKGLTPDAAFISHSDSDHFEGLKALYNAGLLSKVYCSWQEKDAVAEAMPDAVIVPLGAGDTVLLDDMTKAVVLYPCSTMQKDSLNELSLVVRVEYAGSSVLFTGDITGLEETMIFCTQSHVDIYKAAHHGSKNSSYRLPLRALSPEYSIVSVGNNSYGHPHDLALQNLRAYSQNLFVTQEDYSIEFYIDDGIKIHAFGGNDHDG